MIKGIKGKREGLLYYRLVNHHSDLYAARLQRLEAVRRLFVDKLKTRAQYQLVK